MKGERKMINLTKIKVRQSKVVSSGSQQLMMTFLREHLDSIAPHVSAWTEIVLDQAANFGFHLNL